MGVRRGVTAAALGLALAAILSCSGAPRDLSELVLRDSTYLEPTTLEAFSGVVVRTFPDDPTRIQLRGVLRDGTWNGELTVYHPNGSIRFQGELVGGAQCGTWVENAEEEPAGSVYEEIVADIQSLSLYPPCSGAP